MMSSVSAPGLHVLLSSPSFCVTSVGVGVIKEVYGGDNSVFSQRGIFSRKTGIHSTNQWMKTSFSE